MNIATTDLGINKILDRSTHKSLLPEESITFVLNGDIQDNGREFTTANVQNMRGNKSIHLLGDNYLGSIKLDNDQVVTFHAPGTIRIISGSTSVDLVQHGGFNFTGKIKGRYQYVNGERHIYFIEENGPIRFLNIDGCLPKVKASECGDCPTVYTDEFDVDATLFNPKVDYPCIKLRATETGNIPNGAYQVAVAYADRDIRLSDYFLGPQVLKLYNDKGGNFNIEVDLGDCLDNDFDTYELALITNRVDRGVSVQRIGYFNTSQTRISIDRLDDASYEPLELNTFLSTRVRYQQAEHIAQNNETLVLAGMKLRKKLAGYEVSSAMTAKWVTLAVPAALAKNYPSFQRWETYAFDIAWVFADGEESARFSIVNNVTKPSTALVPDDNYWESTDPCNPETLEYWEIHDSSTLDSYTPSVSNCEAVEVARGDFSYWESKDHQYPEDHPVFPCEKIRHFRFPKTRTHGDATGLHTSVPCADPVIHIMGVDFGNITTPTYCDGTPANDIVGYKIYVADRTGQESILSNGLLYNVRYETLPTGDISMFQNYPFNDLNADEFLLADKRNQGNVFDPADRLNTYYQDRFTFVSPDMQYVKGERGTEIEVMHGSFGTVRGEYHETREMPRYQVLSPFGRLAALTAGSIEANEVLKGTPCNKSVTEKRCSKKVDRTTNVDGFPVPDVGRSMYTLLNGTATPNVPAINTTIQNEDYSYTTEGDSNCVGNYLVTNVSVRDFVGLGIGPDLGLLSDTCILTVDTTAPQGVNVTIDLNGNTYTATTDNSGVATYNLNNDCRPNNVLIPLAAEWTVANINATFSEDCECTGDQEFITRTESENCDTKIKALGNLEWAERLPAAMYYFSQGREAVGTLLQSLISPANYAIQYTAVSNQSGTFDTGGVIRRRIDFQQYLTPAKSYINGQRFNNWQQASADYLELSASIPDPTTEDYSRVLASEAGCAATFSCATIGGKPVQASNYYASLKRRMVNQYGAIDNYKTRQITCILTGTTTGPIMGGDVHITQHEYKRPFPLFTALPLGTPDNTEFETSSYPNIGFPRFWMDNSQESAIEDLLEDLPGVGVLFQDYNLDAVYKIGQCFGTAQTQDIAAVFGGTGYLLAWLASLITDGWSNPFKLAGKYYSHVTGIVRYWCESKFIADNREYNELVSSQTTIQRSADELASPREYGIPELFMYNQQYLWNGLHRQTLTPQEDCCRDFSNLLVYSLQQSPVDRIDNWRQLLPNNTSYLPTHTGKLTTIKEVDDYNLMIGFEDGMWITQQDDGLLTNSLNEVYLGTGDAFSRRLQRITNDTTGYGGIIDPESLVVTRYGTYWFDRKRKRFLSYSGQVRDITAKVQGWLNNWGDEPIKGVYDNFTDSMYYTFENKGLVFKPAMQNFVSFLDWGVDEFIQLSDGYYSVKESRLWKHNDSQYSSMFGKALNFEVGMLFKDRLANTVLQGLEFNVEFLKPTDEYDHYVWDDFFDEILAFNQLYSTGIQKLILRNPNNSGILPSNNTDVPVSYVEDFTYRLNGLNANSNQQPTYKSTDGVRYTVQSNNLNDSRPIRGKYVEVRLRKRGSQNKILMLMGMGRNQIVTSP